MPAQKRSQESTPPPPPPPTEEKDDDLKQPEENETINDSIDNIDTNNEQADDGEDSDESPPSSPEENDEFVMVNLSEIRKEVQCPICLGIIRKTRTVMECLHRFCRECIDKAMRLGNNECPACRTHCASRRSLRDDPNYDALIATLYPDIEKYEEEELAFHEEEKARNKQIQASIAQTFRRQTEALGKKRTSARATAAAFMRRSQGTYRNLRGRRNQRAAEHRDSDDEQDGNCHDGSKDSSSADERSPEVKPRRYRRRGRSGSSEPSPAGADVGSDENDSEQNKEPLGASAALVGSSEIFTWGRGGMRSNNRHGSLSGNKPPRNSRLSKLIDSLQSSNENKNKLEMSLMLVSLHEDGIPSLQRPFLSCKPMLSIGHLCQYIASQTTVEADKIEMLVVKDFPMQPEFPSSLSEAIPTTIDPSKHEMHTLEEHQVLAEIQSMWTPNQYNLVLAYREKLEGTGN